MHNWPVDIEFDPAKARANLRKHRVSFADAEQALRDPFALTIDDPDAEGEQAALWLAEARAAGVPTDGDSLLLGDTLVTICPWWDGPATRAAIGRQLAADAALEKRRWIWVYHAPPADSPQSSVWPPPPASRSGRPDPFGASQASSNAADRTCPRRCL